MRKSTIVVGLKLFVKPKTACRLASVGFFGVFRDIGRSFLVPLNRVTRENNRQSLSNTVSARIDHWSKLPVIGWVLMKLTAPGAALGWFGGR